MTDYDYNAKNGENGREEVESHTIAPEEVEAIEPDSEPVDGQGQRIESFLSARTFCTQEWALQHIASQPRGTHVTLGFIAGYVSAFERRDSKLPIRPGDAVPAASIWLRGDFEATVLETGEVRQSRWLILPRSAAELVEEALIEGGPSARALLDLEIGIEATGRSIPYAYTVVQYGSRRSEGRRVVNSITARQQARLAARGLKALADGRTIEGRTIPAPDAQSQS